MKPSAFFKILVVALAVGVVAPCVYAMEAGGGKVLSATDQYRIALEIWSALVWPFSTSARIANNIKEIIERENKQNKLSLGDWAHVLAVRIKEEIGETVLQAAVRYRVLDAVPLLIIYGADPTARPLTCSSVARIDAEGLNRWPTRGLSEKSNRLAKFFEWAEGVCRTRNYLQACGMLREDPEANPDDAELLKFVEAIRTCTAPAMEAPDSSSAAVVPDKKIAEDYFKKCEAVYEDQIYWVFPRAVTEGNPAVVRALLACCLKTHKNLIEFRGDEGMTPLQSAVLHECYDVVPVLLAYGADVTALTDRKQTLLDLMAETHRSQWVKLEHVTVARKKNKPFTAFLKWLNGEYGSERYEKACTILRENRSETELAAALLKEDEEIGAEIEAIKTCRVPVYNVSERKYHFIGD